MTRLTTLLLFLLVTLSSYSQELTVKSFNADPMDLSAAKSPVTDLNDKACGLVKVRLAVRDASFEGSIIEPVGYKNSEYWVYMTEGSYRLTVKTPDFLPLDINFRDYGVQRVMSKQTYVLTLLRPLGMVPIPSATSATSPSTSPTSSVSKSGMPMPEAVELGLSVRWASFNLGASKPEETGNYYKWGETEPTDDKGWATYKYAKGAYDKLTKYCSNKSYGNKRFTDGKTVLEAEDDAATVNLGGAWRMPTAAEIQELTRKCKREWTTVGGVEGVLVTGPNGNSVFLPASVSRVNVNGSSYDVSPFGDFWSATSNDASNYSQNSAMLDINAGSWSLDANNRANGHSVRPVLGK